MRYLTYRSRLTDPMGARVVPEIIRSARSRNAIHGITGVLVFDGERFAQYIEGEPAEVERIFRSIQNDFRHQDVEILAEGDIRWRRYSVWSMAYGRASDVSLIEALGVTPTEAVADRLQNALPTCDLEV